VKITIEQSEQMVVVNGQLGRWWRGVTDRGTRCLVFVALIALEDDGAREEFDAALRRAASHSAPVPLDPRLN
jgi:hypothetical protein